MIISSGSAPRSLLGNLAWGIAYGLAMATALSLYVGALSILRGSGYFDKYSMNVGQIIATYYGCGILAGAILGALRPLTDWAVGAIAVGMLCGIVAYGAVGYATDHHLEPIIALIAGIPVGGSLGYILWRRS